jgi:hypothetical protein
VGRQAANFDPNPHHRLAQEYADQIGTALKEATEADQKWAPKLRALKADDDLTVSDRDWADAKKDTSGVLKGAENYLDSIKEPPKDGTPQENAKWWKGLTAEEQAAYVSVHPASVGALDGLPAEIRDEANRTVLSEAKATYQLELDSLPPEPERYVGNLNDDFATAVETKEWKEWNRKYEHLTSSLKGMQTIEDRFDSTGVEGLPEAYLLGFSPEGNGRAIVGTGNPDTADHTAVYVPGTTSNLGSIGGDIGRMTNLWQDASTAADGESVSTITWLGYDAPQHIVEDSPFSHYADDGAPAFGQFLDGLDASHTADTEGHTTVIAHSYGTTLVGSAARQGDLNADDVILAGSPGVQVSTAEELDVLKGHVWNQEADGDAVPDIGRYGHGGDGWTIPSDERFGANQMTTDTEGHSDYWDVGFDR